ncbi:MAG TPA: molybdopterin cofactor-binding domain-containing protein, partial [Tissierellales bacterium]|nr:molybdopterin cofactor-binding domain-containing protein [Tissierellales bacterium]
MKKRGVGIGVSFYGTGYGNGFPDVSKARVKLLEKGKIGIYVGATEVGQGAKTIMSQIGAETLNIALEDISFINEDTSIIPDSGTAAASRQTYNTGNAIKLACEDLKEKLFEAGKEALELNSTAGLNLEKGEVILSMFPEKRISFKDLYDYYEEDPLIGEGVFTAQTTMMDPVTGQGAPYWPYTFNACAVEVEVDILTGKVEVIDGAFAQDTGRSINPTLVEGQIEGGFSMGLGYGLMEDMGLENGRIKNNKFSKYLIPTAMDMVDIDTIIIEDPENTAPYGAKGIGEPTTIPVAPAILNAIYNATGVRVK